MINETKITLQNDSKIKTWFKNQDETFRIEAVIHDGQYYNVEKWAKVALTTEEKVKQWIQENDNILIKKKDSYRVGYNTIIDWYKSKGIDPSTPIIPNNFTPKIWAGKTEAEHFEDSPRRLISAMLGRNYDSKVTNKIREICYGYGRFEMCQGDRFYIFTVHADLLKQKLQAELTAEEFERSRITVRSSIRRRELVSMSDEFLSLALPFYTNFAKTSLKGHMKTIKVFIPEKEDVHSQIIEWIILAMQKFNEKAAVPFSGYLNSVLQKWPYDLPDNQLGKELAKFQRLRSQAEERLQQRENRDNFTDEEIANEIEMEYDDFIRLEREHKKWLLINKTTELNWVDSGNEKSLNTGGSKHLTKELTTSNNHIDTDPIISSKISLALLKTLNETKDYDSFFNVLSQYGNTNIDYGRLKVSNDFKIALAKNLQ